MAGLDHIPATMDATSIIGGSVGRTVLTGFGGVTDYGVRTPVQSGRYWSKGRIQPRRKPHSK